MKIENKTNYPTWVVERILNRTLKQHVKLEGDCKNFRWLYVLVRYSPNKYVRGYAWRSGRKIEVLLPRCLEWTLYHERKNGGGPCGREVAAVFDHELYHIRGIFGHRNHPDNLIFKNECADYAWADKWSERLKRGMIL